MLTQPSTRKTFRFPMTTLRKLVDIISQSVDAIEASCSQRGITLPPLDEPYTPESDGAYTDPAVLQAAMMACAAASQLSLLVRPAKASLSLYAVEVCKLSIRLFRSPSHDSFQFCTPASLRTVIELHVPEILRAAGPTVRYYLFRHG